MAPIMIDDPCVDEWLLCSEMVQESKMF
jgi:hypothetical protein